MCDFIIHSTTPPSFLLPGVGLELGLNDKLAVSSMIKNELGYNSSGVIINPFVDSQFRYYYDSDKRKENNVRTYKYSGNYLSLVHAFYLNNSNSILGLEYGWQRTVGKNWYYNLGFGAGKWIVNGNFTLLFDLDFGYNF